MNVPRRTKRPKRRNRQKLGAAAIPSGVQVIMKPGSIKVRGIVTAKDLVSALGEPRGLHLPLRRKTKTDGS
jgi:hypothetical protein